MGFPHPEKVLIREWAGAWGACLPSYPYLLCLPFLANGSMVSPTHGAWEGVFSRLDTTYLGSSVYLPDSPPGVGAEWSRLLQASTCFPVLERPSGFKKKTYAYLPCQLLPLPLSHPATKCCHGWVTL